MHIFEITKLNEEVSANDLAKIKAALKAYAKFKSSSSAVEPSSGSGDPDKMLDDVANKVRTGQGKLNKIADAELGKTGADPQDVHIAIIGKTQDAAREAARKIAEQNGLSGQEAIVFIRNAQLQIKMALFGYINKKYLNGDDQNFKGNTMDMITKVMRSQQPKGKGMPVGRASSSRLPGQRGTVAPGQGTNALDTLAARDF